MEKLLILLVFAAFSAIASAIKESKNKKAQQQAAENAGMGATPPSPKPTRVQSEISQFLSGLPPAGSSAPSESRPVPANPVGGANQNRPTSQPKPKKQKRKTDPSTITDRHVRSSVGQHVDSYIGEHVRKHMDTQVDDYVKRDISDHVSAHIGDSPKPEDGVVTTASAGEIRAFLKDPRSVKTAMIVNEIFSRPRALQSRRKE